MTHAKPSHLAHAAALCLLLAAGLPAQAQSSSSGSGMRANATTSNYGYSILPYTRSGYAGINIGKPDWRRDCATGFECDDPDASVRIYTGGLINDVVGLELGYQHAGSADRNGGRTRAQGIDLSLVLRAPIGAFNVFARGGAIYGQTRVSADVASGVATGRERGWGATYGVGAGYDFTPQLGVVLEWARSEFNVRGSGSRQDLDTVSLGLVRRF